jgi:hypothetical protein
MEAYSMQVFRRLLKSVSEVDLGPDKVLTGLQHERSLSMRANVGCSCVGVLITSFWAGKR